MLCADIDLDSVIPHVVYHYNNPRDIERFRNMNDSDRIVLEWTVRNGKIINSSDIKEMTVKEAYERRYIGRYFRVGNAMDIIRVDSIDELFDKINEMTSRNNENELEQS